MLCCVPPIPPSPFPAPRGNGGKYRCGLRPRPIGACGPQTPGSHQQNLRATPGVKGPQFLNSQWPRAARAPLLIGLARHSSRHRRVARSSPCRCRAKPCHQTFPRPRDERGRGAGEEARTRPQARTIVEQHCARAISPSCPAQRYKPQIAELYFNCGGPEKSAVRC